MDSEKLDRDIGQKKGLWLVDLLDICMNCNIDLRLFSEDMVSDFFAQGFTPQQAVVELLSEPEKEQDELE